MRVRSLVSIFAALLVPCALGALAGACSSCKHGDSTSGKDASLAATSEPPVPTPDRMLAEAIVAAPNALWSRLQRGIGGAAMLLPTTFAGLVCTMAGLDPSVALEVDGDAPAFAVIADGEPGLVPFAMAMKLVDARHAATTLLDAETAPYIAKDVAGMRELVAKAPPTSFAFALAPGGYLIVASGEADLQRLGPYVHRTMPTKTVPAEALTIDAPFASLSGPLRARLASAWASEQHELTLSDAQMRAEHDAGVADFGDAAAIIAELDTFVQHKLALLGDVERARLTLDANDDELHAELLVTPLAGGGPTTQALDAMRTGDAAPLLDSPLDAAVAILSRDDAGARSSDARAIDAALARALGPRLAGDDAKKLSAGLDDWAKGRGDWLAASLMMRPGLGILVRSPLAVEEETRLQPRGLEGAALRGVRELLDLTARPVFKAPLQNILKLRDVSFGTADIAGAGRADVARFARDGKHSASVGWMMRGDQVTLAISEDAPRLLAAAKPANTLRDDARIAGALSNLGGDATLVLLAQPLNLAANRSSATAGSPPLFLTLAWGKRLGKGWARVQVAMPLAKQLLRMLLGM